MVFLGSSPFLWLQPALVIAYEERPRDGCKANRSAAGTARERSPCDGGHDEHDEHEAIVNHTGRCVAEKSPPTSDDIFIKLIYVNARPIGE